jgi:hypothetical protein
MTNGFLIREDLVVITAGEAFITEEMYGLVFDPRNIFLGLEMSQTVSLIPSCGKDIKGNFSADRIPALTRAFVRRTFWA